MDFFTFYLRNSLLSMIIARYPYENANWKLANSKEADQTAQKYRLAWLYSGGID
jgi:hypothetical protein